MVAVYCDTILQAVPKYMRENELSILVPLTLTFVVLVSKLHYQSLL